MSDVTDLQAFRAEREDLNHRVALCMYEMLGHHQHEPFTQKLADMLASGWMSEDTVSDLEETVRVYWFKLRNR